MMEENSGKEAERRFSFISAISKIKGMFKHFNNWIDYVKNSRDEIHSKLIRNDDITIKMREVGIVGAYRPHGFSVSECLMSSLCWTNETLNFWTHIVATMLLSYFVVVIMPERHAIDWQDGMNYGALFFKSMTCIMYPLVSSLAHLFNCYSLVVHDVVYCLDYLFLSLYTFGAAIGSYAYVMPHSNLNGTVYSSLYLEFATVASLLLTHCTILSRSMTNRIGRKLALIMPFVISYMWTSSVVADKLLDCLWRRQSSMTCEQSALGHYAGQFVTIVITAIFFGCHIPEIFYPGKFDLVGHSHQIMHVTGAGTTFLYLYGIMTDCKHAADTREFELEFCPYYHDKVLLMIFVVLVGNVYIFTHHHIRKFQSYHQDNVKR